MHRSSCCLRIWIMPTVILMFICKFISHFCKVSFKIMLYILLFSKISPFYYANNVVHDLCHEKLKKIKQYFIMRKRNDGWLTSLQWKAVGKVLAPHLAFDNGGSGEVIWTISRCLTLCNFHFLRVEQTLINLCLRHVYKNNNFLGNCDCKV